MPQDPPISVRPMMMPRDYADSRKVIIVGGGASGHACAETLRHMNYTGEITIVNPGCSIPYDKDKLTKQIRNVNYDEIPLRSEDFLNDFSMDHSFGESATGFYQKGKNLFLKVEDHSMIEFDAVCIASGSKKFRKKINKEERKKNVMTLNNIRDHKKMRHYLENGAGKVVLLGINLESLELASTIRLDYPKVEVKIIDPNQAHKNYLYRTLGKEVSDSLIKYVFLFFQKILNKNKLPQEQRCSFPIRQRFRKLCR